jgi:hypothetical protein
VPHQLINVTIAEKNTTHHGLNHLPRGSVPIELLRAELIGAKLPKVAKPEVRFAE